MTRPVIIGGGLAGGAAAARLAQLGRPALLFEREAGPHDKVCGEFLSGEAVTALGKLGLDCQRLGGVPIGRVVLRQGRLSASAALPFPALGLGRRVLDDALLDHAAAQGTEVKRGVTVRRIAAGRAVTSEGEAGGGPILLATGKYDLRGEARDTAGTVNNLIGFKQLFRAPALAARLAGTVEVIGFAGGYAGLQPVDGGRLNLCLVVDRGHFASIGGRFGTLFEGILREPGLAALADAEPTLPKPLAISRIPYGFLAPPTPDSAADPLWRLGDQAAVIPSFCGDGMAMAVHGGVLAADMLAAGATAGAFQARLRRDTRRPVRLATTLQRAITTGPGRLAMVAGLAAVPGALRLLARLTRVA